MENLIKEIEEKIIEPFYVFPNPTSIELSDKDVDLVIGLIKEYKNLKMQLEVEKIDNKYNKEENCEETIPRYKIRKKIEYLCQRYDIYEDYFKVEKVVDILNELLEEGE